MRADSRPRPRPRGGAAGAREAAPVHLHAGVRGRPLPGPRTRSGRRALLSEAVELGFDLVDVRRARRLPDDVVAVEGGARARALVARPRGHARRPRRRLRPDGGARPRRREDRGHRALDRPTSAGCWPSPRGTPRTRRLGWSRSRWARSASPRASSAAASARRSRSPRRPRGREAAPGQIPARTLVDCYRVRQIGPRHARLRPRRLGRPAQPVARRSRTAPSPERGVGRRLRPAAGRVDAPPSSTRFPALGVSGFSVTRPYKGEILRSPRLRHAARRRGGVGEHGGGAGRAARRPEHRRRRRAACRCGGGSTPSGRAVAILGAGGAARAAAFALVRAGARVTVAARGARSRRREVAAATGCAAAGLEDAVRRLAYDVLVNATPVGSGRLPGPSRRCRPGLLRPGSVVFDMVYEPRETPLLAAARARGLRRRSTASRCWSRRRWGSSRRGRAATAPVEAMTEAAVDGDRRGSRVARPARSEGAR